MEKLSVLFKGISSKHDGNFHCLNCLHSLRRKNNAEATKKVSENKDINNAVMLSEDTNVFELN